MKITIAELLPGEEEEIVVKCRDLHPEILKLLNRIKSFGSFIMGYLDGEAFSLNPADIFYVEAVDRAVFLYDESHVYESKKRLYELEETLAAYDFVRISKSVIVNMRKIKSIVPSQAVRLTVVMRNGEKLICSRQYVNDFKKHLGM